MLKKPVRQGRSERRGEEVHTALRVNRSPFVQSWRTDKIIKCFRPPERLNYYVSPLSEARTQLGAGRVSARRVGWVEKRGFFSILLDQDEGEEENSGQRTE